MTEFVTKTTSLVDTLPEKLSELLELALKDFRVILSKPWLYKPYLGDWHSGEDAPDGVCHVCLAGSTLANTLHLHPGVGVTIEDLPESISRKLKAIDWARILEIASSITALYGLVRSESIELIVDLYALEQEFRSQYPEFLIPTVFNNPTPRAPYLEDGDKPPELFLKFIETLASFLKQKGY